MENYGDDIYLGYDLSKLKRDECYLTINNPDKSIVYLYSRYLECYLCPSTKYTEELTNAITTTLTINTNFEQEFHLSKNEEISLGNSTNKEAICQMPIKMGEFGIYELNVQTCDFRTVKEPVNIYLPILTVLIIILCCTLVRPIWKYFHKKCLSNMRDPKPVTDKERNADPKKQRLKSLDTFRGIAITVMIFVNYGHGGYPFLEHAIWNGLAVGDLVFPWFMWIMGVCIPISIISAMKKGTGRIDLLKNIFRRSCILFALGLFLGASPYLNTFRIFGVLQRFGICYFVTAFICLTITPEIEPTNKFEDIFRDILRIKKQWIAVLVILLVHCLFTFLLPIPGCPTGYLGPGGLHDNGNYKNCTGGSAGYLDDIILGKHIYQYPLIKQIYQTKGFDPEGILGCLTSIVLVFIGVQAGLTIIMFKDHKNRLTRWLSWGVFTGILGGVLCNFSKEDGIIPINKNLWSLSFILVTSSFAFILLSLCYYIIDMKFIWSGKPFFYAGMNATIMYVGHSLIYSNFPIHWYWSDQHVNTTHFLTLVENVWATGFWVLIAYYLYTIKFFLSI